MKHTSSCRLYWVIFKGILKREISKRYDKKYTNNLLKKQRKKVIL